MKTIKFQEKLIPLVLSGEKTSTWRLFDDKNLSVGDEISLLNKETLLEFAKGMIIDVTEKKFGDLKEEDWKGHERFESTEKMYETYCGYYGDRVNQDSIVKMIEFKLI